MNTKKTGTHSTQRKYFGTIPRSEFYGFVLGYAVGLILTGALRLQSQFQEILCAVIGLGIGYYIDKKYYQEPDEAVPEAGGAAADGEEILPEVPEADGPAEIGEAAEADGSEGIGEVTEADGSGQIETVPETDESR